MASPYRAVLKSAKKTSRNARRQAKKQFKAWKKASKAPSDYPVRPLEFILFSGAVAVLAVRALTKATPLDGKLR